MSVINDILQGHPLKKYYEDEENGYVVYPSELVYTAKQELSTLHEKIASLEARLAEALERNVELEDEKKFILEELIGEDL